MRFSGASIPAVSGPVSAGLAAFGGLRGGHRPRAGHARRCPRTAARPLRGSPGPARVRRCDLRAAVGAVGRQGAVCPGAGERGLAPGSEIPARSTPRHLAEAARSARALPAGRSDPPVCSWDSVRPAQAPQIRLHMDRAFLKKVSVAADNLRVAVGATEALTMAIQKHSDDCALAKFDVAWDQFGSNVFNCSREQFRNSLRTRLRRAKL